MKKKGGGGANFYSCTRRHLRSLGGPYSPTTHRPLPVALNNHPRPQSYPQTHRFDLHEDLALLQWALVGARFHVSGSAQRDTASLRRMADSHCLAAVLEVAQVFSSSGRQGTHDRRVEHVAHPPTDNG